MTNLEISFRYLKAIEEGQSTTEFFDPAVIQEEFPNRLTVNGARRTLADTARKYDTVSYLPDFRGLSTRVASRCRWISGGWGSVADL